MLRLILAFSCALSACVRGGVAAQDYPRRPMRLIVGYGAGGADVAARTVAEHLEKTLGQPVTVENRPGSKWAQ